MAILRLALGLYLAFFGILMIPYALEVYGTNGLVYSLEESIVYNPLLFFMHIRSDFVLYSVLALQILLAIIFALGIHHKVMAVLLWLSHVYFFNLNPYANSPEYSYIGWLLLAFLLIPLGLPLSLSKKTDDWRMPKFLRDGAWIVLGVSYTNSGVLKALSPGWIEGTALVKVGLDEVNSYGWTNYIANSFPHIFMGLNWFVLLVELLAILFVWKSTSRKWFWICSVFMHIGVLLTMKLAQVSLGMLIFHLLLFDPAWLPQRQSEKQP